MNTLEPPNNSMEPPPLQGSATDPASPVFGLQSETRIGLAGRPISTPSGGNQESPLLKKLVDGAKKAPQE